ncbi:hypothetical protein DFR52_10312 [Hoeflea marina]|uniref:Flagellar protein n=1 Tax=Hoeflea marina TaxID=274592 RepID=A0A317PIZ7_9HYPH|nr:hypothetical protein DFR52_10312 [Hoeflea marina]
MTTEPDDLEEDLHPARRGNRGDRLLTIAGFALAATAAFFPWYVFLNQDSFGIRPADWGDTRDMPETAGRSVVNVSPLAIPDQADGSLGPSPFDPITTATATAPPPDRSGDSAEEPDTVSQTFPGRPRYRLLHVANGRAMIEDQSGIYIVRVGSVLPDNSRLSALEMRDGRWVIINSNGEVVDQ